AETAARAAGTAATAVTAAAAAAKDAMGAMAATATADGTLTAPCLRRPRGRGGPCDRGPGEIRHLPRGRRGLAPDAGISLPRPKRPAAGVPCQNDRSPHRLLKWCGASP